MNSGESNGSVDMGNKNTVSSNIGLSQSNSQPIINFGET